MRTTVTLDDDLLRRAEQLCDIPERSRLLREARGWAAANRIWRLRPVAAPKTHDPRCDHAPFNTVQ